MFKRYQPFMILMVLMTVASCGWTQAGEEVSSQPGVEVTDPIEVPRGGVAMAIPADCELVPLVGSDELLHAVRNEGAKVEMSVALKAFAVAEGTTPEAFGEDVLTFLDESLTFRNVETQSREACEVLDLPAETCCMTYDYRGQDVAARSVSFVREVEQGLTLCYLLMVEVPADQAQTLEPTVHALLETVAMSPIQSTEEMSIEALGDPLTVDALGYSIAQPEGWFGVVGADGVEMGMMDFTTLQVVPFAKVMVGQVADGETAEQSLAFFLEQAQAVAAEAGLRSEVVSQDDAELGGVAGKQFVLLETYVMPEEQPDVSAPEMEAEALDAEAPAAPEEVLDGASTIIVQRTIIVPREGQEGQDDCYSLILLCDGDDVEHATQMMDDLAAGFELVPVVEAD